MGDTGMNGIKSSSSGGRDRFFVIFNYSRLHYEIETWNNKEMIYANNWS